MTAFLTSSLMNASAVSRTFVSTTDETSGMTRFVSTELGLDQVFVTVPADNIKRPVLRAPQGTGARKPPPGQPLHDEDRVLDVHRNQPRRVPAISLSAVNATHDK